MYDFATVAQIRFVFDHDTLADGLQFLPRFLPQVFLVFKTLLSEFRSS
jgi:hypothetical protein